MPLPVLQPTPDTFKPGGASSRGSHRLAQISICKRAWYWRWVRKYTPRISKRWYVEGTLIHLLLAYHYASMMSPVPEWVLKKPIRQALEEEGAGYPDAIQLAVDVYTAYRAKRLDAGGIPIAVETEFSATIGEIARLFDPNHVDVPGDEQVVAARIDLLQQRGGKYWDVDYKSTLRGYGRALPKFNPVGEWRIPWQFMVQSAILQVRLGDMFGGVLMQRIKRAAPFDMDFQPICLPQRPFREMPDVLREQCLAEVHAVAEIQAAEARGENMETWMPEGSFWNCFSWGHPCDYADLCATDTDSALLSVLESEYKQV